EPGLLAGPAHEPRLGLLGRARHRHRHRSRPAPAREARARSVAAAAARDGVGRRLPAEPMSLRAQLALLAVAAVCLPLVVVVGSGLVMFGMHEEWKFWLVAAGAALCALAGALLLGRQILRPLDRKSTRLNSSH